MWTQSQAKQDDWPEETWKKYPILVIQTITRAPLWTCPCESVIFSPPNKHFTCFTTFHLFVKIHFYKANAPMWSQWCDHSPRARHQGVRSQVGLRKDHFKQSYWKWWNSSWPISNPKRWCCENAALNMSANLENSAGATGLEKISFHSNPKER